MARSARHANPSRILNPSCTFFVTTKTSMGRALLLWEGNATLLIDVLRSYVAARKFQLHYFVGLPISQNETPQGLKPANGIDGGTAKAG